MIIIYQICSAVLAGFGHNSIQFTIYHIQLPSVVLKLNCNQILNRVLLNSVSEMDPLFIKKLAFYQEMLT